MSLGLALVLALGAQVTLGVSPAAAATFTVTTTSDVAANTGACGNPAITVPASPLSLREAVCLVNNIGGANTITIPAGTYHLANGELAIGMTTGQAVTLQGAGAASTIIDADGTSRVLDFDPNLIGGITGTVTGLTVTGGADSVFGGAGIIAGSANAASADSLTVTNSVISDNHANGTTPAATNQPGGGIQFIGGSLTIQNSVVDGNSSANSPGSGVAYQATGTTAGEQLNVTGTVFSNNSNVSSTIIPNGGALDVTGLAATPLNVAESRFTGNTVSVTGSSARGAAIRQQGGSLSVLRSTFTGNSLNGGASSVGGAVEVTTGTATLHHNRFTGNVAPSGSAIHAGVGAGAVNAANNWFGCNGGPGAVGCDTVSGTVTSTPWLVLTGSATPSALTGPDAASTIRAALTENSAGGAVAPADLTAFTGQPVAWSDPQPSPASLSATTTDIAAGAAQVSYDSETSSGPGHVMATLDNATVTVPLTVNRAPTVTLDPADQTVNDGDPVTFTAAASGYPAPGVQWQRSTNGGSSFTDIGGETGPSYSFNAAFADNGNKYRAVFTNSVDSATTTAATLSVGTAPAFTSASTATFVKGVSGTFTVTTTGVPTPSIHVSGGALPPGVVFTDNGDGTATLAGSPTAGGTFSVTLTAQNGTPPNGTQALTVQVNTAPEVTADPSNQTVNPGTPVTFTAAASGIPTPTVQWQRSTNGGSSFTDLGGETATSLSFTAGTGDDGYQYRAVFTNVVDSDTTAAATLRVGTAPAFTSANSTTFEVGTAGTFAVTTSGVPNAALTTAGTVPAWLSVTDNGNGTGTLSGTPPAGSGGSYTFTLQAANGFSPSASQSFTLLVNQSPAITSANHTTFTTGSAGGFTITTSPGYPTATSLSKTGALPSGVTFTDNGDGTATLAGTPAAGADGSYPLTVSAAATGGTTAPATQAFTLTVNGPPSITSANHTAFDVAAAGTFTVTTDAGTPTATTLTRTGALPSGVSFTDNGDGTATLAGTPAAGTAGSYPLTLKASNGVAPDATQSFTLTVRQPPTITSADHVTFAKGAAGSFTVTTTPGVPGTVTLSAPSGDLPPGTTFTDNGDGTATLGGVPTADGVYPFTITASNGVLPDATQSFTATVTAPPTITSADHATFTVGAPGTFTVTTDGGTPTATTLTKTGTLPAGLTFTDNGNGTATLAGTPTADGVSTLTITASNGVQPDTTQTFTATVQGPPAITSADHATFSIGTAGSFTVTTEAGTPALTTLTKTGTLPAGVMFTDSGNGTATVAGTAAAGTSGDYPLTVKASNGIAPDATQSFVLHVSKLAQAVTFTSSPPAQPVVGGSYDPTAASDSGLTVSFSIDATTTNAACSLTGSTVSFDNAGTCVVNADQAGNGTYAAAPRVQQSFAIERVATDVSLSATPSPVVYGQPSHVTATVAADSGAPAGTVQFAVDGDPLGAPVPVAGGEATSPDLADGSGDPLSAGSHQVTATFTPTDATTYSGSIGSTTQVVNQAGSETTLTVQPTTLTATLAAVAPGSGTPTGQVTFSVAGVPVGSAVLVGGVAVLDHTVEPGMTQAVAASYSGDANFTGSSDSVSRHDPTITAEISSRLLPTRFDWYRTPVKVVFLCASNGAPLTERCPRPARFTRNGAGQSVTRTIHATDGGAATAVAAGISIDRRDPRVRVGGVRDGGIYDGAAPRARCVGTDRLSGIATCRLTTARDGDVVRFTAVATDKAGNRSRVRGSYRVLSTRLSFAQEGL